MPIAWKPSGRPPTVAPLSDDQRQAAEEQHAGQGDDERRDADVGDPEALPGADRGAERPGSRITASGHGTSYLVIRIAATAPMNAATEPTDRSMWPAMMTITMPMARIRM